MVVGAYYPEMSGAGLQCRTLIGRLRHSVDFIVLTTTARPQWPTPDVEQGTPVHRVFVEPRSILSKMRGLWLFTAVFLRLRHRVDIVHLHGFSQKSVLIIALAYLTRRKIAIKLTSFGDDDPEAIARRGWLAFLAFRQADLFFAVSPRFRASYDAARLPADRFRLIPNGVDLERFTPASAEERQSTRRSLGLPIDAFVVLFVGFFSREKQPDLMFDAWAAFARDYPDTVLVFVGATLSNYYEIDGSLAARIRARATGAGLVERLHFVESTHEIEQFHRAADVFAMPSLREGMPNALLEAMASGSACVVSLLPGITDRIVDDGRSGLLVDPADRAAWTGALRRLALEPTLRVRLGAEARRTAIERFGLGETARAYLSCYGELLGDAPCAG